MTVAAETPINTYTANGATTVFAYTFRVEAESELTVYVDDVEQASGFTVSGVGDNGGGSVTFSTAPASAAAIVLLRDMPTTRAIDYQNAGDFRADTIDEDLDRVWLKLQQLERELDYRALQFPETAIRTPTLNALPLPQSGQSLQWQADGSLANYNPVGVVTAEGSLIYESFAAAMAGDNSAVSYVRTTAFNPGWAGTTAGPEGGATYHRDGTTGTASTAYSDNSGFYDANGAGFSLSFDAQDVSLGMFGCSPGVDSSANFVHALTAAAGRKLTGDGTIRLDTPISYDGDVNIDANGLVLDLSGGGNITLATSITSLPDLSADITGSTVVASFASAHGLEVGDVFIVYNPTDYSFSPARDYYRDGCMFRVASVDSATAVKFFGSSPGTFSFGSMSCYKLNGGSVSIKGVDIIPTATGLPLWIDGYQDVSLDISARAGAADTAIDVYRCYSTQINSMRASAFLSDAYPIVFANCQNVVVQGAKNYSTRHCIALGGRSGDGTVPTRNVFISDCILENLASFGIGSADIHGNCENVAYSNCFLNTGANIAGVNVRYSDCVINGRDPTSFSDGTCIFGSEIGGGVIEFSDCRLITYGNSQDFGAVHLSMINLTRDAHIIINGMTIDNRGASPSTARNFTFALGDSSPTAFDIKITIDGVVTTADDLFALVAFSGANDLSSQMQLEVKNSPIPAGASWVAASNSDNYAMPMRLPFESHTTDIASASGVTQVISGNISMNNPLPKLPSYFGMTVGSVDGTANNPLVSGKGVIPSVYAYTQTTFRPMIASGDAANFTAIHTVRVFTELGVADF